MAKNIKLADRKLKQFFKQLNEDFQYKKSSSSNSFYYFNKTFRVRFSDHLCCPVTPKSSLSFCEINNDSKQVLLQVDNNLSFQIVSFETAKILIKSAYMMHLLKCNIPKDTFDEDKESMIKEPNTNEMSWATLTNELAKLNKAYKTLTEYEKKNILEQIYDLRIPLLLSDYSDIINIIKSYRCQKLTKKLPISHTEMITLINRYLRPKTEVQIIEK